MALPLARRTFLISAAAMAALAAACSPKGDNAGEAVAARDLIFVSDERGNAVFVLDPNTGEQVARIENGITRPRDMKFSPDGTKLYVAVSGTPIAGPPPAGGGEREEDEERPAADPTKDGIASINLADYSTGPLAPSGPNPETFVLMNDGTLFVANESDAEVTVINMNNGQIRNRINVGDEPEGTAVTPDGKILYVCSEAGDLVHVIDIATSRELKAIALKDRPRSVIFDTAGAKAYVSNENGAHITVIDAATHTPITTVQFPPPPEGQPELAHKPMQLVLSPRGDKVYVSTGRGKAVVEVDTATNTVSRTFADVGDRPWGIAINDAGTQVFTANGPGGDVSVIDVASGTVARKIAAGTSPWGVIFKKG